MVQAKKIMLLLLNLKQFMHQLLYLSCQQNNIASSNMFNVNGDSASTNLVDYFLFVYYMDHRQWSMTLALSSFMSSTPTPDAKPSNYPLVMSLQALTVVLFNYLKI